jgi:DNA repair protein RadD
MIFTLRPYQSAAVSAGVKYLLSPSKRNGVAVLPTGSGKSLVVANIAKQLPGKTIVFQPSKELLEQNVGKYLSYGESCEIYSASAGRKKIAPVTFATIGSVVKKPHLFKDFKYCIVDECDLVNPDKTTMYQKFFKELNLKVLGLTATPIRNKRYGFPAAHTRPCMLDRMRPRFFSDYVHVTQISEMVENGYFADTRYHVFDFDNKMLRSNSSGGAYTEQSIDAAFQKNDTVGKIIDMYRKLDKKGVVKHILIFCESLKHADQVSRATGCPVISGTTPKRERERVLTDFKKGRIKGVVNVGVLTVGFDFPELDCLICARPTMSIRLYYQIIGRGVRPHETKKKCHIFDMVNNFGRFGRVEDFKFEQKDGKWVLHNGRKILTNRDIRELEEVDPNELKMPFGKYKGVPISKVPVDYLTFCYENHTKGPWNQDVFLWVEENVLVEEKK